MRSGWRSLVLVIVFVSCCVSVSFSISPQNETGSQIDPFYTNLLQEAQKSFRLGDYREAIKQLEIAVFGLRSDSKLVARAYAYLSMSYFIIKDQQQSERFLNDAARYLDESGFPGLGLEPNLLFNLESIWYLCHPPTSTFPGKPAPVIPTSQSEIEQVKPEDRIKQLEEIAKKETKNIAAFYELHDLYLQVENRRRAKKTLDRMLKYNNQERRGHFLIARIEYAEHKYGRVIDRLKKVFKNNEGPNTDRHWELEAWAYFILGYICEGNKTRAFEMARLTADLLTETTIQALPLRDTDKARLIGIVRKQSGQATR